MTGLAGQVVLITGAGGGIGTALVDAFAASGARIVACDQSPERLEGVAAEASEAFEITDPDACRDALTRIERTIGVPNVVISNAGYAEADTFATVSDDVWARELAVNLTGARNVTAPLLPAMQRRGSGAFVFIASINGLAHFGNPA